MDHHRTTPPRWLRLALTCTLILGTGSGLAMSAAAPAAADTNYCAPDTGATPGADPIGAFSDDTNDFYRGKIDWVAATFPDVPRDIICKAASHLIESGAKAVVLGGVEGAVEGDPALNPIPKSVMKQIWDQAIEWAREQNDPNNPLLVPVGPTEGSIPAAATWTVDDAFLSGSWGRTDTMQGGDWHGRDSVPSNGQFWYDNGDTDVSCTLPGAGYTVHFSDGSTQEWTYWVRTVDGLYLPAGVFDQVVDSGQPALPLCS